MWGDSSGNFNVTLKGSNEASDYFDGTASAEVWQMLKLTNNRRDAQNLSWLRMTDGLTANLVHLTTTLAPTARIFLRCSTAILTSPAHDVGCVVATFLWASKEKVVHKLKFSLKTSDGRKVFFANKS